MNIISLWSGPRNVSTALMYSFAQRNDTQVIDEPLYGHYLTKSDAVHIGQDEIIQNMNTDGHQVMQQLLSQETKKITFLKNMAHHWIELSDDHLTKMDNIFLIRNPEEMLPSLSIQIPTPILRDTGLKQQVDLYKSLEEAGKAAPVIIESKDLLLSPDNMLSAVCQKLNIPFDKNMLSWKAGPRPEDGIWAKHWYHNVHKSTGFAPYKRKEQPFPNDLEPLLQECNIYYEFLSKKALKP